MGEKGLVILFRPLASKAITTAAPAVARQVAKKAPKQLTQTGFAARRMTRTWSDDFVDWLIRFPKPQTKPRALKPVFNPDEWVKQTLERASQTKWIAPVIKTNEGLAAKSLRLMANGYAQLTKAVEPYLQNWRIVTRTQLDALKPPIEELYHARMATARSMVRSSSVQGVVGTGLVGSKFLIGAASTLGGAPPVETPIAVLIPMMSAGISLMARSVFGILEGRREILSAHKGLEELLKLKKI